MEWRRADQALKALHRKLRVREARAKQFEESLQQGREELECKVVEQSATIKLLNERLVEHDASIAELRGRIHALLSEVNLLCVAKQTTSRAGKRVQRAKAAEARCGGVHTEHGTVQFSES